MKKISLLVFLVSIMLIFVACGNTNDLQDNDKSSNSTQTDIHETFNGVIDDEVLIENICNAMTATGINPQKISSVKKIEDWASGKRYNFVYKNVKMTIYTYMDSTVRSIKLGSDTFLYLKGYEPYNIEDFLVDSDMQATLQINAEDKVKSYLNYPSTADFPFIDWSFGRDHELYSVSSTVEAMNAFGVKSEIPFKLIYKIQDNTTTLVYFTINGNVVINDESSLKRPERQETTIQNTENQKENLNSYGITLIDGQLGAYGKEITLDGYKYINYHVPAGTYTVKNNTKWCKFYIAKDEYLKNSDGYMENEVVKTIEFESPNETATITINQGEHIELTLNASVTLFAE